MSKAVLEKEIVLESSTNNYDISGYLYVKSSETIDIDVIGGIVYFEARGRMASMKREHLKFRISDRKTLEANVPYKIPFSFTLDNVAIGTYKGKNVDFTYRCEARIHIEDDDIGKVDRSFFSKVKSFVTSDDSLKDSAYFYVGDTTSTYQVEEATRTLNFKTNIVISIIIAVLFAGIYLFLIPEYNIGYIALGLVILILILIVTKMYMKNALGDVTMETLPDEDAFLCTIKKTRKFNLANQYLYYKIVEEVVDDRGTSSSTYRSTLHTSEKKKLANHRGHTELKFTYPTSYNWHSNELGDVEIYWEMYLVGTTYLGFTLKYTSMFFVAQRRQVIMK